MGDNPDGLTTSGDQKVAERLIEKIEENIANMKKKWTDVFVPQLEEEDPNNLLGEWDDKVHDISEQAENTIDELRKAIKTFIQQVHLSVTKMVIQHQDKDQNLSLISSLEFCPTLPTYQSSTHGKNPSWLIIMSTLIIWHQRTLPPNEYLSLHS